MIWFVHGYAINKHNKGYMPPPNKPPDMSGLSDHALEVKIMMSPHRRKMISRIGVYGATREELQEATDLDDTQLRFNIEFLLHTDVARKEDGKYYLTKDRGMALLEVGK